MDKATLRHAMAAVAASTLSFALAAPQLLMAGTMLIDLRTVVRGFVGWAGTFSLVFLGAGALALSIALPAYYWRGVGRGVLRQRLLRVLAIQCFLYPVLHLLSNIEHSFRYASRWDLAIGGAGLVLGGLFAFLAARTR